MTRKIFILAVQGLTPEQESAFSNYLKQKQYNWWHWVSDFWIITKSDTGLTAEELQNLVQLAAPGQFCIVLEVYEPGSFAGFIPKADSKKAGEWLDKYWKKDD